MRSNMEISTGRLSSTTTSVMVVASLVSHAYLPHDYHAGRGYRGALVSVSPWSNGDAMLCSIRPARNCKGAPPRPGPAGLVRP
jgi:hypothetical protein